MRRAEACLPPIHLSRESTCVVMPTPPAPPLAMAGALIATGAQEHQRGPLQEQCRCVTHGLRRVRWKLDSPVAAPVVHVAEPPLPLVLLAVAGGEFGAIPLRIEAANGLVAHIYKQRVRLAHQAFQGRGGFRLAV